MPNMIYQELISKVQKPSQYLGNELNTVKKNLDLVKAKICLAFPELYEIGMSHLGLKILYELLNKHEEIAAERAYAPAPDYAEMLKKNDLPLTSLESNYPLNKFDLLGFSMQHEMNYTSILYMLELAKIPWEAKNRGGEFPLIIGGGPCVLNPEPMADFFDLFVVGDAEEVIITLINTYTDLRSQGKTKKEILDKLSEIKGIYVPSLFEIIYSDNQSIKSIKPLKPGYDKIDRIYLSELKEYPQKPLVPFTELVHDRVAVEIDRGCTQGCRFCQAGYIYRPVRERDNPQIIKIIENSLQCTGYEEFSLVSLSSGDHYQLLDLIKILMDKYSKTKTAVSLPSLRPPTLNPEIIAQIKRVRQTGFTIVPEAGTQRLRNVINKNINENDILKTVEEISNAGWKTLKLYFMIGLPTETDEDIQGIADLCLKILKHLRNTKNNSLKNINVSVSSFIPKPHTPFQWYGQLPPSELIRRQNILKSKLRRERMIDMKFSDGEQNIIEAMIARGDRRLSKVILKAVQLGAKFDAWTEYFDFKKWKTAFTETNIDPAFYAGRSFEFSEILPWDIIQSGIKKKFLIEEYSKAIKTESLTPDCRFHHCNLCGLENRDGIPCPMLAGKKRLSIESFPHSQIPIPEFGQGDISPLHLHRLRLRFEKLDLMRFVSHLELGRVFYRTLRRANIPLAFTQGFHPHPRISFGFPLPVGQESSAEFVEIVLDSPFETEKFITQTNSKLPLGLKIISGEPIPLNGPSLNQAIEKEVYLMELKKTANIILSPDNILVKKEFFFSHKEKQINVRPIILGLKIVENNSGPILIELTLKRNNEVAYIKPGELIGFLFSLTDSDQILKIKKTDCFLKV